MHADTLHNKVIEEFFEEVTDARLVLRKLTVVVTQVTHLRFHAVWTHTD